MNPNRLDPITLLLFLAVLIFTGLLIMVSRIQANDGQTFQVISGLLTAFAGALLGRINPRSKNDATSSVTLSRTVETVDPPSV